MGDPNFKNMDSEIIGPKYTRLQITIPTPTVPPYYKFQSMHVK